MTRSLTPRQQNVFDFIVKTMNELGYPRPGPKSPARSAFARPTPPRSICGPWNARGSSG
ncbi:hypothetical protein A8U91_00228 [Halomonas elongata]|uniref:LexA repressor DNA-binding domain-containing protein n=1 Tax=Halomonas elongata TaxID=2746 RepID=A0A1B8P0X3_HALEL|nr:hypothetical protein A8U91_00228 [Halomonas elongata]